MARGIRVARTGGDVPRDHDGRQQWLNPGCGPIRPTASRGAPGDRRVPACAAPAAVAGAASPARRFAKSPSCCCCGRRSSAAASIGYFALTLPDTSGWRRRQRRPSITILAADGSLLATYGDLFGQPLTLQGDAAYLPQAVIATEDRRFYSHFGIDPIGLLRAALRRSRGRPCRPRRQHDHPAAGEELVSDARAQPRPQDPRDPAGPVARASLHQGPDSRNLSEPGLSRRRHLWRRCRGASLFRQVGGAARPLPERGDRRAAEGADAVQPDARPRAARRRAPRRCSPTWSRPATSAKAQAKLRPSSEAGCARRDRRRAAGDALFRRLDRRPGRRFRRSPTAAT